MATKLSWSERLRDPRWQRKRLEVMQRADFCCEVCRNATKTLNVHHGFYDRNLEPWEYPDSSLKCLCEEHHRQMQGVLTEISRELAQLYLGDLAYLCMAIKDTDFRALPSSCWAIVPAKNHTEEGENP